MLTSREAKELRALRRRADREAAGRFLAEGVRVVEDLLDSPLRIRWIAASSSLGDTARGAALTREIGRRGIPTREVPETEFDAIAATESPQGIVAIAEIPRTSLNALDLAQPSAVVLVLDAIQDPGNLGTLVRSAEALGAAGVILLPGTVDPWNPKSVRAAAGSAFRLPIIEVEWEDAQRELRDRGMTILGGALEGEPLVAEPGRRYAIVVGNEGRGLSPAVRAGVDRLVRIPLRGRAESLNVAAAGAILLHEAMRGAISYQLSAISYETTTTTTTTTTTDDLPSPSDDSRLTTDD